MKLPFVDQLIVSETKLKDYLLSDTHPLGRTKAAILRQFGYRRDAWSVLATDLIDLVKLNEVSGQEKTQFGIRFVVDGILDTPSRRPLPLRTIWFLDNQERIPHFVTAYPR